MTIKEKMEMVHRITERKESFAGVTKLNEFIYDKTNGKVPAGLDYHIHYTTDQREFFMSGGTHSTDSRIINRVSGTQTLYSQYKKINILPKTPYPIKITPSANPNDYKTGFITRYFVKEIIKSESEVFETSEEYFNQKNSLYSYAKGRWKITGDKATVGRQNIATALRLNRILPGVVKLLKPFDLWRPSVDSQDYLEKRLALRRN